MPYDSRKDLAGVALMGISPLLAAIDYDAPLKTAKELINFARANPGQLSFGSSGSDAAAHSTSELFKSITKTYMVHIPHRGQCPRLPI